MASRGGFLVGDGALRRKNNNSKPHHAAMKRNKPLTRTKKKPEWDDTLTDLNANKATQEELRQRHEAHKSRNIGHLTKTADKENHSLLDTPDSTVKRKQAILQEILYGQDKFQEVLAETDRSLSAVKDLFGDDPKKFLGFPNVTVAPYKTEETSESRLMTGPFADVPETPTHLSMLSESIMRTPALNELSDDAGSESSDTNNSPEDRQNGVPAGSAFQPKLDLQRYRQFISYESTNEDSCKNMTPEHLNGTNECNQGMHSSSLNQVPCPVSTQPSDKTTNTVSHQTSAMPTSANQIPSNDRCIQKTTKINVPKKAKIKTKSVDTSTASSNSGLRNLEDLKKMVESLEDEIAEYEMETGRQPTATISQTSSFSGYTSSLINAVTKLMKYLNETETQRKAEAILRDQIIQGFAEQRTIIDALTNDVVQTQEQYVALQSDVRGYKQNTDHQLNYLQRELQTVLQSFEYHAIQSTINTLHSTRPIPINTLQPQHSATDHGTKGDYIPLSAMCDETNHYNTECLNGVTGPTVSRPELGNDMISSCTVPSSDDHSHHTALQTHIHTSQSSHQHPTYLDPAGDRLTVPGPIQLGIQQTNVTSSTATGNHGIPTRQAWPATQYQNIHYTDNPQTLNPSSFVTNQNGVNLDSINTGADYPPKEYWKGNSLVPNGSPKPSHQPLHSWGEDRPSSLQYPGVSDGLLFEGIQNTREDSLLVTSLIKDPQTTRQLRHRLHGIAMKQKNSVAMKMADNGGTTGTEHRTDKTLKSQPSPHVHFKFPLEVPNEQGPSHKVISGLPEQSPSVSPIPDKFLDVPIIKSTGLKKGKHVVVNLPSVWSDVSSTVSV